MLAAERNLHRSATGHRASNISHGRASRASQTRPNCNGAGEVRSFSAFEGHTGPVEGPQDLSVGAQKTKDDY